MDPVFNFLTVYKNMSIRSSVSASASLHSKLRNTHGLPTAAPDTTGQGSKVLALTSDASALEWKTESAGAFSEKVNSSNDKSYYPTSHIRGDASVGSQSLAFGYQAGGGADRAIALGYASGGGWTGSGQGTDSICIGHIAGGVNCGNGAVIIGKEAAQNSTTNSNSVAVGLQADVQSIGGIAIGKSSNAVEDYSIAIGLCAKTQADNSIAIGKNAETTVADSCVIKQLRGVAHGTGVGRVPSNTSTYELTYSTN